MTQMNSSPEWQWTNQGVQQDFAAAFAAFRSTLSTSWASPEDDQRITDAYVRCAEVTQEPWQSPDLARRVAEAHTKYLETLGRAADNPARRAQVAQCFQRYIADLVAAWSRIDPKTVTAFDLAAIGQSMLWVANLSADIEKSG